MNQLYRKTVAIVIIILFLGVSVIPVTGAIIRRNETSKLNNQSILSNDFIFDRYIKFLMKIGHMPSLSACIIKDDEVVWSKGYGLCDIENNKAATEDTIYMIASISKTVTATAIMQLYDEGLFDLDDNVSEYLPFDLKNPNYPDVNITFRMLLAHQSSLAEDEQTAMVWSCIPGDPDIPSYPYPWLEEYLIPNGSAYSPSVWSDKRPGEEFNYANIGFSIIGYLVELISGQQFDDYCKDHIFTPLDMYNTSYHLADIDVDNLAVPYKFQSGEYIPYPHYNVLVIYPAVSLRTSVNELLHFLIAHMNKGVYKGVRILNENTTKLMHEIQYPDSSSKYSWQYGLGWWIIYEKLHGKEFGHQGGWHGIHTGMAVRESDNTAVIYFTNLYPSRPVEKLAYSLIDNALFWKANKL